MIDLTGLNVVVSEHAMRTVPRFPDKPWTKRRRRRVIGRHGSWTVKRPCAWVTAHSAIVHPAIYAQLKKETANARR